MKSWSVGTTPSASAWTATQFAEDLAMVVTQAHPGEGFSDIYAKADRGMASYDRLRNKLLRAARERAESYPLPVRLRLGSPATREARQVALPVVQAD